MDIAFSHKDCRYIIGVTSQEDPLRAEEVEVDAPEVDAPAPPVREGSISLDDTLPGFPEVPDWESVHFGGSRSNSSDQSSRSFIFFCALARSGSSHSFNIFLSYPCPVVFCIAADWPVFLASGLLRSWFEVFVVTTIVMMKAVDCRNGKVHGGTC